MATGRPSSRAASSFGKPPSPPASFTSSQSMPSRRNKATSPATVKGARPTTKLPRGCGNGTVGGSITRTCRVQRGSSCATELRPVATKTVAPAGITRAASPTESTVTQRSPACGCQPGRCTAR